MDDQVACRLVDWVKSGSWIMLRFLVSAWDVNMCCVKILCDWLRFSSMCWTQNLCFRWNSLSIMYQDGLNCIVISVCPRARRSGWFESVEDLSQTTVYISSCAVLKIRIQTTSWLALGSTYLCVLANTLSVILIFYSPRSNSSHKMSWFCRVKTRRKLGVVHYSILNGKSNEIVCRYVLHQSG